MYIILLFIFEYTDTDWSDVTDILDFIIFFFFFDDSRRFVKMYLPIIVLLIRTILFLKSIIIGKNIGVYVQIIMNEY